MVESDFHDRLKNTGRNDPCPCGSGKKYKMCHLIADEKLEYEELKTRNEALAASAREAELHDEELQHIQRNERVEHAVHERPPKPHGIEGNRSSSIPRRPATS